MSSLLEFEPFPKIPRLKRDCIITEKIDGTNAQICFSEEGTILCGSRKRIITPEDDNYGFARWAYEHHEDLFKVLGKGRHFGEWWGQGIQRRYGLDHKNFSLFNTARWSKDDPEKLKVVEGLSHVPILYDGAFDTDAIEKQMTLLYDNGSVAAPGYRNPEGIIIYQKAANQLYKKTFDYDETGKPE